MVLGSNAPAPFFKQLAATYLDLTAYRPRMHPSLPNYVIMTSGSAHGISDDVGTDIGGTDNLAAQMDAAGVTWRAYAESMPSPCYRRDTNLYAPRHVPWLYYTYVTHDPAYCANHVVPMGVTWQPEPYRYIWITPNMRNDAHDAPIATADAWLASVMPKIMASPGYQNGGAVLILFDEPYGTEASTPAILVSESVRGRGVDATVYDHRSYLATVEDLLGLPRLATTQNVPSMARLMP
jgi:hypothetical protein